jgi:hypothetical protein
MPWGGSSGFIRRALQELQAGHEHTWSVLVFGNLYTALGAALLVGAGGWLVLEVRQAHSTRALESEGGHQGSG